MGRTIGGMDALSAAMARFSGSAVATRDTTDPEGIGLTLIDPWR